MPLNNNLGTEIKEAIEAAYGKAADDPIMLQKFCDAIASTVIAHFKANAVITTAGTVTSGAGAGGTTASTGTIS